MGPIEIIILAGALAFAGWIFYRWLKKGKSGCSSCAGCPANCSQRRE